MARLAERIPETLRHAPQKVFPGHWTFLFGELAMFSFFVLVATGVYLALFYEASGETVPYQGSYEPLSGVEVPRSYASVLDITFERPAGALIRQTHHWAALVFVGALVAHAARVFFTGAFRRPRRLNWVIGLTLLLLAMGTGFFGVSLPQDLLGGSGARIGHSIALSIPLVGPGIADLLFAGEFGNVDMVRRFWLLHVFIFPLLIVGVLGAHMALLWVQTHTQFGDDRRRESNVVGNAGWPGYALKTTGLFASVAGVLLLLGAIFEIAPIWLDGPFDPAAATVPAQPDWYLGWVEGALQTIPPLTVVVFGYEIPSPFFSGVLVPTLILGTLFVWPFAEARLTGDREPHHLLDRARDRPVRTAFGVAGMSALGILLASASQDVQGLLLDVPVGTVAGVYLVLLVVGPPAAWLVTYRMCKALVRNEQLGLGQPDSGDERTRRDHTEPTAP